MQIVSNFFLSLILAALISFTAPIILVGFILALLSIVSCFPALALWGNSSAVHIFEFLAIFGNGKPLQGILTLGLTVSIVGVSLDALNFYRYQSLRD